MAMSSKKRSRTRTKKSVIETTKPTVKNLTEAVIKAAGVGSASMGGANVAPSKTGPVRIPEVDPTSASEFLPKSVTVSTPIATIPKLEKPELKKKELIDLVVARSGIKKREAKPVVEAMLAVLGETIGSGRELNLQPLGKLRINRTAEKPNGQVIICKLLQKSPSNMPDNGQPGNGPVVRVAE